MFENGKFIAYTHDTSCADEYTGQYVLVQSDLLLDFGNKPSNYLGTKYVIKGSQVKCLNCTEDFKLEIKQ